MQLVPNSWGALREANPCHHSAGRPDGGQFAPKGTCAADRISRVGKALSEVPAEDHPPNYPAGSVVRTRFLEQVERIASKLMTEEEQDALRQRSQDNFDAMVSLKLKATGRLAEVLGDSGPVHILRTSANEGRPDTEYTKYVAVEDLPKEVQTEFAFYKKEIERYKEAVRQVEQTISDNHFERLKANAEAAGVLDDLLKVPDPVEFTVEVGGETEPGASLVQQVTRAVANRIASWTQASHAAFATIRASVSSTVTREFAKVAQGEIHLNPRSTGETIAHEIGHLYEQDRDVRNAARDFLSRRVNGPVEPLKNYGSWYRDDEVAFVGSDKAFMSPYAGKLYPDYTEIMSMGIQWLYGNPVEFARRDPQYFDFVVDMLRYAPSYALERAGRGRRLVNP
jgi:hypothetical protein